MKSPQELSRKEKLEIIGLSNIDNDLSNTLVDLIYEEKIIKYKKELVLSLLNKILIEHNNVEIDDICQFKILVKELKKIDGIKFVDENIKIYEELQIKKNKDLKYNTRLQRKNYIITVLKITLQSINYKLESFQTSKKLDDGKMISMSKYRAVKNI